MASESSKTKSKERSLLPVGDILSFFAVISEGTSTPKYVIYRTSIEVIAFAAHGISVRWLEEIFISPPSQQRKLKSRDIYTLA